jgi:hypothetical protein
MTSSMASMHASDVHRVNRKRNVTAGSRCCGVDAERADTPDAHQAQNTAPTLEQAALLSTEWAAAGEGLLYGWRARSPV